LDWRSRGRVQMEDKVLLGDRLRYLYNPREGSASEIFINFSSSPSHIDFSRTEFNNCQPRASNPFRL
jgi:hypothetical protein